MPPSDPDQKTIILTLTATALIALNLTACSPLESDISKPIDESQGKKRTEKIGSQIINAETYLKAEVDQKTRFSEALIKDLRGSDYYYGFGTMHNDVGVKEHQCYTLGVLLGKSELVSHLHLGIVNNYLPITERNSGLLHDYYASLENFAAIASSRLALSDDERSIQWNLNCAGSLGIPSAESIAPVSTQTFYQIVNDGYVLNILGDIEDGFSQKVIDAINDNPGIGVVALGSGGGSVYEAIWAGRHIREKGLTTALWSNCYSACPLVFMGGATRMNWSPYPSLGFHQIYSKDYGPIPFDSQPYVDVYRYITDMGIDADYVVLNMWAAAPNEMNIIDGKSEALCEHNITTWIQRGCNSRLHVY